MESLRIGLNLVTIRNGKEAKCLLENLDRVQRVGFQGVGLWASTIESWLGPGRSIDQLAEEVSSRGLEVHELCFVSVLDKDGNVIDASRTFELARALGAGAVISIYGARQATVDQARLDWARFVGKIDSAGVPAAFEFLGFSPPFNSPLRAWEVIQAGPELGTMVFDTFHFWRGGGELSQIGQVPSERISLVHLNDVNDVPRERAADSDRTFPGRGVMPLAETLGLLLENGFAGPFSVEIFGQVQQQDPDDVCARAYEAAAAVLSAL